MSDRMACILNIETSTKTCSLALSKDGVVLLEKIDYDNQSHVKNLSLFTAEAMRFVRENQLTIQAVAVSSGPGSYTGLRIGVAEAKGLCYGLGVPLIAIPTLKIMASQVNVEEGLLCPMIDARRMEVYDALYDKQLAEVRAVQAEIIDENALQEYLACGKVFIFGDGSDKCKPVLTSPNAIFVDNIHPLASAMAPLADLAYQSGQFVDTAYYEPFYLKEYQAVISKNKVIG